MIGQWTEQETAQVIALKKRHLSFSAIGRAMGRSRNSICGKLHRLGMTDKRNAANYRGAPVTIPAPQRKPVSVGINPDAVTTSVASLGSHQCKWPVGDVGDAGFHFCCASTERGNPYCAEHMKAAYVPVKKDAPKTHWNFKRAAE